MRNVYGVYSVSTCKNAISKVEDGTYRAQDSTQPDSVPASRLATPGRHHQVQAGEQTGSGIEFS